MHGAKLFWLYDANYAAAKAERELAEARAELALSEDLVNRLGKILNDTINVLRGLPPELHSWSTHDTAVWAARVVDERDEARNALIKALQKKNGTHKDE